MLSSDTGAASAPLRGEAWLTCPNKMAMERAFARRALAPAVGVAAFASGAILLADRVRPAFRHERLGQNGKPFSIIKLTTLGAIDKVPVRSRGLNEARATQLGRILRIIGVDEFPQMINVLRGDMALVAPDRPRAASDIDHLRETLSPSEFEEYWHWYSVGPPGFMTEFTTLTHRPDPQIPDDYFSLAETVVKSGRNASLENDRRIIRDAVGLVPSLVRAAVSSVAE